MNYRIIELKLQKKIDDGKTEIISMQWSNTFNSLLDPAVVTQ